MGRTSATKEQRPVSSPGIGYKIRKIFRSDTIFLLSVLIPTFAFYIAFTFGPIVYAFYVSLHDWNVLGNQGFIGFANYERALTRDPLFFRSLTNTALYTLGTVPTGLVLGLLFAWLINVIPKRLVSFFRTIYFLPVVTSLVAAAVIWEWLYQPRFGLFNQLLSFVGIGRQLWLESASLALVSIIIMVVWKGLGHNIVLFMAGLQGIPQDLYEAASIDGATRWQTFRHVTVPLLRPVVTFVSVIGVINGFQAFSEMWVMTRGGPLHSTRTIVLHLYQRAFETFQLGYASATAFILLLIILVFTVVQLRLQRTNWEY